MLRSWSFLCVIRATGTNSTRRGDFSKFTVKQKKKTGVARFLDIPLMQKYKIAVHHIPAGVSFLKSNGLFPVCAYSYFRFLSLDDSFARRATVGSLWGDALHSSFSGLQFTKQRELVA